jgi:hypothetical protein
MSFGDYVLPWKAIPNMIRDVKDAGGKGKDGKKNHGSVVGAIGKYADPFGALLGDRWMEFAHERLPTQMNEWGSGIAKHDPFIQLDRKYGLGQKGSPLRGVSNWAQDRPADTAAIVTGAVLGGGALAGAWGGGSAGSAGGMSAYGPYASGYQFAPGSSFGGAAGGGTAGGMSAYGPYASGYQFPATSPYGGGFAGGSGGTAGGATGTDWSDPNTYRQMAQQQGQQQQPQQQTTDPVEEMKRKRAEREAKERAQRLAEAIQAAQLQNPYARFG